MESSTLFTPVVQTLGWTLLHSLWQGLVLFLTITLLHKVIPGKYSTVRYGLNVGALASFLVASIITFVLLLPGREELAKTEVLSAQSFADVSSFAVSIELTTFASTLERHFPAAISAWLLGVVLLSGRLIGGAFYLSKLRRTAIAVEESVSNRILELSYQLGIHQFVEVCESARITVPMVLGVFRPVILLPVGMATGLSTQQLESILIHELIHIRRYDYAVNLVQSVLEAIFFFNPFVWLISSRIRTEREHCCDDAVVQFNNDPFTYAHALSRIEELRLSVPGLAIPLAKNKSQLFNRITRIMEKTFVRRPMREQLLPLALLIIVVVCTSWITLSSGQANESIPDLQVVSDTIKNPVQPKQDQKVKKAEPPVPAPEVAEPIEEMEEHVLVDAIEAEELEALAAIEAMSLFPPIVEVPMFNMYPVDELSMDSIPYGNIETFNHEFEKAFRERFETFYQDHREEWEQMMAQVQEQMAHSQIRLAEANMLLAENMRNQELRQRELIEKMERVDMEKVRKQMEEVQKRMESLHHDQQLRMKEMEKEMREMELSMRAFQEEMQQQLIEDGYLKKGEKINNMHFDDAGDITINGKKIKESDKPKYKALQDKFRSAKVKSKRIVQ